MHYTVASHSSPSPFILTQIPCQASYCIPCGDGYKTHFGLLKLVTLRVGVFRLAQVTLKLIETFVDKCEDLGLVTDRLVPAMMDPILGDYHRNVPDAR